MHLTWLPKFFSLGESADIDTWILQAHLQAFLALDELRVLVALFREINNVHPVALIVQGGSRRDVLCLRRAQGDSIRVRLPLHAVAF